VKVTPAPNNADATGDRDAAETWVTWPQAAELVGCGAGAIEHQVRVGRIEHRPRHGNRPTLSRESVLAYAAVRRQQLADKEANRKAKTGRARARQPQGPPTPTGWLSLSEAAAQLEMTTAGVRQNVRAGHLSPTRRGSRLWFDADQVDALAAERHAWISQTAAAELVGCPVHIIERAVRRGLIQRRKLPDPAPPRPTLDRASVQTFAELWAANPAAARNPPAGDTSLAGTSEWVSLSTAAALIGCSPVHVVQQAEAGRILRRPPGGRRPSVNRRSALAYAQDYARDRDAALALRRAAQDSVRPRRIPPPPGHVWIPTAAAVLLLQISRSRLYQAIKADQLPSHFDGTRHWLRRDIVEQLAARRVFLSQHDRPDLARVLLAAATS
jgi:hypothetical protein